MLQLAVVGLSFFLFPIAALLCVIGLVLRKKSSKFNSGILGNIRRIVVGLSIAVMVITFLPASTGGMIQLLEWSDQIRHPVLYAVREKDGERLLKLLEAGKDINDPYGSSPIGAAASIAPSLEMARLLVARGADVNLLSSYGETPLTTAILYNQREHLPEEHREIRVEIVELLLQSGADPDLPNENGKTPLEIAASEENEDGRMEEIIALLLEYGATEIKVKKEGVKQ